MKIGYARVSTRDQEAHLQTDALTEAGCERIFEEKASGAQRDRPELHRAIEYLRPGGYCQIKRGIIGLPVKYRHEQEPVSVFQDIA